VGRACAYVEVADDGVGFAPGESASAVPGRGLRNMRRRAEELGGTLIVHSTENGTVVRLMIPLDGVRRAPTVPATSPS
jgi:signal transduction histidine kinase